MAREDTDVEQDDTPEAGVVHIKRLAGWMSLHEAGQYLGIQSKQGMHRIVWDACEFDFEQDVRLIGERPVYVVRTTAVKALKKRRDKERGAREARRAEKESGEPVRRAAAKVTGRNRRNPGA